MPERHLHKLLGCLCRRLFYLLADIIIMIQKQVPFHLKKGGIFISSGIIDMKEQAVREALEANEAFEIIEVTRQGEWVSFTARKK